MPAIIPSIPGRSPWIVKFVECLFCSFAVIDTLSMFFYFFPGYMLPQLKNLSIEQVYRGEVMVSALFAFLFSTYWQFREKQSAGKTVFFHAVLVGILRYWLAFGIATYGFAKILKTQFGHSFQRDDSVVHGLSGFNLTWQYFSYSYPMTVIIGSMQILGSILLLFRRTTLLGSVILLPVLVNIVLINIFYHIAIGAFVNAVLYSIGLMYLIFLRRQELKKVFINAADNLPGLRMGVLKYPLKLTPIVAAFFMIYHFMPAAGPAKLSGKWTVDFMIRYGDTVKANAWLTDASVWSNIYLEEQGSIAVCANPHFFDEDKSLVGSYHYNDTMKILQLNFPNRRVNIAVSEFPDNKMEWRSIIKKDSLYVRLRRTAGP